MRTFISPLLDAASDEILANRLNEDPKSLFQEWAQSQGYPTPRYNTRNATGPDHSKEFSVDVEINGEVFGSGKGHSKQAAAKMAAQDALNQLGLGK